MMETTNSNNMTSSAGGGNAKSQPLNPSSLISGPFYDRSVSCDPEQTPSKPQHSKSFLHNHLSHPNVNMQWKSAEDIFLSSRTGSNNSGGAGGESVTGSVQAVASPSSEADNSCCSGGACDVSNNSHRLVSSVSAYPLANTNSISTTISVPIAASTSTIASTSSSSSAASATSFSHSTSQPPSTSSGATPDSISNISNANTGNVYTNMGHVHHTDTLTSNTASTSTPIWGELNASNSGGGVAPLDLSAIPPITQVILPTPTENGEGRFSQTPPPSPRRSPTLKIRQTSCDSCDDRASKHEASSLISREGSMERSFMETSGDQQVSEKLVDSMSRSSESSRSIEAPRTPEIGNSVNGVIIKERKESRDSKSSDKKSNKSWYKMLNPTYKSRSEDLKRLFKDLPSDERLIVDYSCALQKDILVHGRLYVTPNYFSFYSKIFGWETFVSIKCKDIIAMTKEKTALVIPNAIEIKTEGEKHFFTSFASRDKTYLMLFRIWQNALMDQQMSATELWQWVHSSYGDELGLTSDDDDYVAPSTEDDTKTNTSNMPSDRNYDSSFNTASKLYSIDSLDVSTE
ncbi:Protein Aster-B [Halocaridina rubra]|uniref:Protein Aster-B n=1 Tax=Halocaridina rubra TaxID=373956 RepID=A0AAN8XEP1_HALRR